MQEEQFIEINNLTSRVSLFKYLSSENQNIRKVAESRLAELDSCVFDLEEIA